MWHLDILRIVNLGDRTADTKRVPGEIFTHSMDSTTSLIFRIFHFQTAFSLLIFGFTFIVGSMVSKIFCVYAKYKKMKTSAAEDVIIQVHTFAEF